MLGGSEGWGCHLGLYNCGGSDGKESIRIAGDPGSIPRSGRSPREGNGYPLQYSSTGKKELDMPEQLTLSLSGLHWLGCKSQVSSVLSCFVSPKEREHLGDAPPSNPAGLVTSTSVTTRSVSNCCSWELVAQRSHAVTQEQGGALTLVSGPWLHLLPLYLFSKAQGPGR